ncbi:MAG: ATP-binding protein, partial [Hyphomicrobiaceae bacterium]
RDTPDQIARYRARISGPLLDRIDIQIHVPALTQDELMQAGTGEPSAAIRNRVQAARERQMQRQGKPNAALGTQEVERFCRLDAAGETLLKQAITRLNLSARAYHRVLKLARSVADLAGSDAISTAHLAEAIQYRRQAA